MEDLRAIASRLWERAGRRPQSEAELEESLVFKLRWFKPTEARRVVRALLDSGLWVRSADGVVAAEEVRGIEPPFSYHPPEPFTLPDLSPPLERRVLLRVASSTGEDPALLERELRELSSRLDVTPAVGAVLLAHRRGMDLPELREEAGRALRPTAPVPRAPSAKVE